MKTLILENSTLRLEYDEKMGTLVKMTAVKTGWEILDRPQLGLSFRLLVPLPGRRNNSVYGEKQIPASINISKDNRTVVFITAGGLE